MKRWLGCALTMAVVLGLLAGAPLSGATEETDAGGRPTVAAPLDGGALGNGFRKAAASGGLELYLHEGNGEIAVRDTAKDVLWTSSPVDREEEEFAKGVFKMSLSSLLTLTVVDSNSNSATESTLTCYTECVLSDGGVTYEYLDNGFRVILRFVDYGITVPLEITLEDGALCAAVDSKKIEETTASWIRTLSILPYFGAANQSAEGYLLVPDGCGALIRFNNGKTTANLYEEEVYGADLSKVSDTSKRVAQQAYLPVFGLNNGENGYLAVIDGGAANASIRAEVAGKRTSYNAASAFFTLRDSNVTSIGDNQVTDYEEKVKDIGRMSVRYYFYSNGGGYSEMARLYRSHLMEQQGMEQKDVSRAAYIQVLNSYPKESSFLGFSFKKQEELTSYDETRVLLERLMTGGVDTVRAVLKNWDTGSVKESITQKPQISSALGGSKAFWRLQEFGEEKQVPLYLSTRLAGYRSNGWLANMKDAARNISNVNIKRYDYSLSTSRQDIATDPQYLLAPSRLMQKTEKLAAAFHKKNLNTISVDDIATMVYADYTKGSPSTKSQTAESFTKALEHLRQQGMTMTSEGANGYALPYLNAVVSVPVTHSGFDLEDEAVPFYQLVLNGVMEYTTPAVNLSSDPRSMFLKALETGSNLHYLLADNGGGTLEGTRYSRYYSLDCEDWLETMMEQYAEYRQVWEKSGGMVIADHMLLEKDVTVTTYANGCRLVVNYSGAAVETAYGWVDAGDYLLAEGA